jgi:hypothetical protein
MDAEDEIPLFLPLQKGGIPLFEKEGVGEILEGACLVNYGLLCNGFSFTTPSRPGPLEGLFV